MENKVVKNKILEQVKKELEYRNISIATLSKNVDVSPSTLYDVLNGRSVPRIDTLQNICNSLGLELCVKRKHDDIKDIYNDVLVSLPEDKQEFAKRIIELLHRR